MLLGSFLCTIKCKVFIPFWGFVTWTPTCSRPVGGGGRGLTSFPAVFSNNPRSLHILSKTRLSLPHFLGVGGLQLIKCMLQGGRTFFDTSSVGKLHPPAVHRKNDTPLIMIKITQPKRPFSTFCFTERQWQCIPMLIDILMIVISCRNDYHKSHVVWQSVNNFQATLEMTGRLLLKTGLLK